MVSGPRLPEPWPTGPMTDGWRHGWRIADRYAVERELGRGGMATVHAAHDVAHDRLVAVKVLREDIASLVNARRFTREIHITAATHHPHILSLARLGRGGGTPLLRDALRGGRDAARQARAPGARVAGPRIARRGDRPHRGAARLRRAAGAQPCRPPAAGLGLRRAVRPSHIARRARPGACGGGTRAARVESTRRAPSAPRARRPGRRAGRPGVARAAPPIRLARSRSTSCSRKAGCISPSATAQPRRGNSTRRSTRCRRRSPRSSSRCPRRRRWPHDGTTRRPRGENG